MNRRDFLKGAAVAGVALSLPSWLIGPRRLSATDEPRVAKYVNVRDYGAVGDGVHDDAPAFQRAIRAAAARGGGVVLVPSGSYNVTRSRLYAPGGTLRGTA